MISVDVGTFWKPAISELFILRVVRFHSLDAALDCDVTVSKMKIEFYNKTEC